MSLKKQIEIDTDDCSYSESFQSPSPSKKKGKTSSLRNNCRSLPLETQRQLMQNALDFGGHDNFAQYCNLYSTTFGYTKSKTRAAVYNRRRFFLKLLARDPEEFDKVHLTLCQELGTVPLEKASESIPLSTTSTSSDCSELCEGFEIVPSFSHITEVSSSTAVPPSISKPISLTIPETMSELPVYKVDLRNPEANPNGWMAFELLQVEYENEVMDLVVLQKHFYDLLDVNADGLSLTLSECGTMIQVSEQSVPTFMGAHFRETTLGLHANGGFQYVRQAMNNAIEVMLQNVNLNPNRQVKEYILLFPDRIKLAVGKLNNVTNRTLEGQLDITTVDIVNEVGPDAPYNINHYPTMTYVIEVDASRRVLRGVKAGPVNALSAYMSRMNVSKK